MTHCTFCNTNLPVSKFGYDAHIQRYHSQVTPVLRKLKPENFSGRSKKQIVADVEKVWAAKGWLIQ